MADFDSQAESEQGEDDGAGAEFAHRVAQTARKAEAVDEAEAERDTEPQPAVAAPRPEDIFQCDEDDAPSDDGLDE